ncbi:MAG: MMPL family transporter, partial [Angustibacter sp.]
AGYPAEPTEQILIRARTGELSPVLTKKLAQQFQQELRGRSEVASVGEPLAAPDGKSAIVPVVIAVDGKTGPEAEALAQERVGPIQSATQRIARANPAQEIRQVGDASLAKAVDERLESDFQQAELLSLPITLIILLLSFGALLAAAVPVLLALSAVGTAIGLSALISQLLPVTDALASVTLLIGMAVGVDYSLFAIRRAREERARGADRKSALDIAAQTSGRAVVISGLAVLVSMSGLLISGNATFESMAVGTMVVVAVAMVGSLTALPAVLALLGDWVDRPRIPLIHRLTSRRTGAGAWPAVLRVVVGHPVISFVLSLLALLALALPALNLTTGESGSAALPRSIPEVATYDTLTAAFPREGFSHDIVLHSKTPMDRAQVALGRDRVVARADSSGQFSEVSAAQPQFAPDGRTAILSLPITGDFNGPQAVRSLEFARSELKGEFAAAVPTVGILVTGPTAASEDFASVMSARLPWVMGFVLTITLLILLLAFRSLVIAATAVVLNLVSVGAAYGILVLVFQEGFASDLLNTPKTGFIVNWLPLFLFVVLFGLSMDYHVFVVSRIREAYLGGLTTKEAIVSGVSSSAGVVTSAALVMVGVFSIFATLTLLDVKQLGIGLAAAIFLDATLVRAVLLPAAMTLLGKANWWLPRALDRRLPHWSH